MTVKKIYKLFPKNTDCIDFLEGILWADRVICPYCSASNYSKLKDGNRYHCNTCNTSFSVTVSTIFHKTKCDLQRWFYAIYLLWHADKEITIRELAKQIGVAKQTAQQITNRIKN